jgi:hypothetical protein
MVLSRSSSPWLLILLPIVLGAIYSLLLHCMAKGGAAGSVFRSSLLIVIGVFTLLFLWMLSIHYFPDLYPNYSTENVGFDFIIYLGVVFFAMPFITLFSIFTLWLLTKPASEKSVSASDGWGGAMIHGGFWGLLLVVICFAISYPTYALVGASVEQIHRGVKNLIFVEVVVFSATFISSLYLTVKTP